MEKRKGIPKNILRISTQSATKPSILAHKLRQKPLS